MPLLLGLVPHQMIPLDSFVGQSADGKMVPIIPGGNSIPLTFSNRKEYVERAVEYRLHEMDRQVSVPHAGLVSVQGRLVPAVAAMARTALFGFVIA